MAFDFIQSHAQDTHHFFLFTVIIMVATIMIVTPYSNT